MIFDPRFFLGIIGAGAISASLFAGTYNAGAAGELFAFGLILVATACAIRVRR